MSDFSQIMVGAIITAIFTILIDVIWKDGSRKKKAILVAVAVIALLAVIVFAGYNGWISFPKMEPATQQMDITEAVAPSDDGSTEAVDKPIEHITPSDTGDMPNNILNRLGRIAEGLIMFSGAFIGYGSIVWSLWGLLALLLAFLPFKSDSTVSIDLCISGLILSIVLPFIEHFIPNIDMNLVRMLSIATAPVFGISIAIIFFDTLERANISNTSAIIILFMGIFLSVCLYVLMSYETLLFLKTHQFAPLFDAFKWIADAFLLDTLIALFS